MNEKILCVDDDINILTALQRQLRKDFEITGALGPEQALKVLAAHGPFAAVMSDFKMPGMNGMQFLSLVRDKYPDTVRILLTGQADMNTAIIAVNEGSVFRFLTKPCSTASLAENFNQAIGQHRLIVAQKDLLENTLRGSVNVLTDLLAMVHPVFSRSNSVRQCVSQIVRSMHADSFAWQMEIAAMLCQVGCVTVPAEVLAKVCNGDTLSEEERRIYNSHPVTGARLISGIPRLEAVAGMIELQLQPFEAYRPTPDPLADQTSFGAQALRLAVDYDRILANEGRQSSILEDLAKRQGEYNPAMLAALGLLQAPVVQLQAKSVYVNALMPGMLADEDIYAADGGLLLGAGLELSESGILFMKRVAEVRGIRQPIRVLTYPT